MNAWVVMASGPSMTAEDADLIRRWRDGHERRVITVNTTYQRLPEADVIYAYDPAWWSDHIEAAQETDAELWSASSESCRLFGINQAHLRLLSGGSGTQAARLALTEFLAGEVFLVGFDMQHTGADEHWHLAHPAHYPKNSDYSEWRSVLNELAIEFKGRLFNASRESALNIPRIRLEDALC